MTLEDGVCHATFPLTGLLLAGLFGSVNPRFLRTFTKWTVYTVPTAGNTRGDYFFGSPTFPQFEVRNQRFNVATARNHIYFLNLFMHEIFRAIFPLLKTLAAFLG